MESNEVKDFVVNAPIRELKLVENYIKTLNEFKNENFKIFNINDVPKNKKMIWVICYEPNAGYNCSLPNDKKNRWNLIETKQNHLLN